MEIKVRRKSAPWWMLLLLALLIAGLLWFVVSRLNDGDDELAGADAGTTAQPNVAAPASPPLNGQPAMGTRSGAPDTAGSGEAITSLDAIIAADDPRALAGRQVNLESVPVPQTVGDATFWTTGASGQRVFVVLDQQIPSPPAFVEGRVNVNAGQTVSIRGVVRRADDLPAGDVLEAADRAALRNQQVYIWAQSARVVSPAEFAPHGPPGLTPKEQEARR